MEIIHLILGKANPERMNGVNKVVHQVATRQAASGRNVAVWGVTGDVTHNYGFRNFETKLFQAQRNPFQLDAALKKAILRHGKTAVFHLHGGWIPMYATLSRFFAKYDIPFVLTPHGAYNTIAMKRNSILKSLYFQLFEKGLLKRAKKVHAIGESEVEGLSHIYPNNKSFLLPYGFELPEMQVADPTLEKEFIVGFVGRLDIYTKGLDLLLEAFIPFSADYPDARLWIVGDSDERPKLTSMIAERNLQDRVVLWGSKFGKEKFDLMRRMSLFVHPSRNEGLPASVLEACGMGIPCIVSKATNVGSFITRFEAGISIGDENAPELAAALAVLKSRREKEELEIMANNARKMVKEAFNWDTLVAQYDALYQ